MPDFADQHRERAIFEGMLQALALDGRRLNGGGMWQTTARANGRKDQLLHEMKMSDQIATCGTEAPVEKRSIHIISIASHSIEPIA